MHTLQYIAIEADGKEEAANTVETLLNEELNPGSSWYDWFIVGGGRFAKDESLQYEDTFETVISYADTPDVFDEVVSNCKQAQGKEFQELLTEYKDSGLDLTKEFENWDGEINYSMSFYPVTAMLGIMQGKWDYHTRLYDITNWSNNPHHMNRSIADGNKNWFLVPIDFHF